MHLCRSRSYARASRQLLLEADHHEAFSWVDFHGIDLHSEILAKGSGVKQHMQIQTQQRSEARVRESPSQERTSEMTSSLTLSTFKVSNFCGRSLVTLAGLGFSSTSSFAVLVPGGSGELWRGLE